MACPVCGRLYCDHTPAERGQTYKEMMADAYAPHVIAGVETVKEEIKSPEKRPAYEVVLDTIQYLEIIIKKEGILGASEEMKLIDGLCGVLLEIRIPEEARQEVHSRLLSIMRGHFIDMFPTLGKILTDFRSGP